MSWRSGFSVTSTSGTRLRRANIFSAGMENCKASTSYRYFEGKIDFIKLMLRELRCGENDWIFVGDDKNDVPIAKAAPVSVAYRAVPELKAVATYSIEDFAQLQPILR